jgi:SHS2 domain-containing protein
MLLDFRAIMERDASDSGRPGISGSPLPYVGSTPGYEPVEHTADLAYIARGRSLEQLFAHAALGMFAFLIDLETVEPREAREVRVRGIDREECLIGFLQELLFREETEEFLVTRVGVRSTGPPEVLARVWGEHFDPTRHELLTDIKAATYHDLEFRTDQDPEGELHWVRIVLDI